MRTSMGLAFWLAVGSALALWGCNGKDGDDDDGQMHWHTMLEDSDPDEDDMGFAFVSAWGNSVDDMYFAGGTLEPVEPARSAALHFDGERWELLPIEVPQSFWWVTVTPDGAAWFAGEEGMIVRWYEGASTEYPNGIDGTLFGIWGAAPDDIWSVGGHPVEGDKDVLLHFDGADWTRVDPPEEYGSQFFKVWGSAADDVFVIGNLGVVLHYDGNDWTRMDVPVGDTASFTTVHGRAADDVWVVGHEMGPVVLHYDGSVWEEYADPSGEELFANMLQGVYVPPEGDLFISGVNGVKIRIRPDMTHVQETLDGSPSDLHGIWANSEGRGFAVGGNYFVSAVPERQGTIIYRGMEGEIPTEGLPENTSYY